MSNFVSTLYSHNSNFDQISNEIKNLFPKAEWDYERKNEFTIATITLKSGFLQAKRKIKISYRERETLGYDLETAECPVTRNLAGMFNLVESIHTNHDEIKTLLLQKIKTINAECSVEMLSNAEKEFKQIIRHLAEVTQAIVFAQPRTGLMNSLQQGWLDHELNLILDMDGNSNVNDLKVNIDAKYFDSQENDVPEQIARKNNSELILRKYGIKVNENLPAIPTIDKVKIRTGKEIAERAVALALTNLVAFENITGEKALQIANKNEITNLLTPKEIEFLKNPTKEAKKRETWKCEGIWTLCWALGIVDMLEFPNKMADLSVIPGDQYPIGSELKPREFIAKNTERIEGKRILDANDLYYRLDWACVDARMKEQPITGIHQGVVYERHYALNWLINYRSQDWDQISTDT